jgi:TonB family protein
MNPRVFRLVSLLALCAVGSSYAQDTQTFLSPEEGTSAVDAKGIRHSDSGHGHPGRLAPWMQDRVHAVGPFYPLTERAARHEGRGEFRLRLDLNTGLVVKVTVAKSTGFPILDRCAVMALRQWRWKPGRWREIDLPVTFVVQRAPVRLEPGAVRLPQS